MRPPGIAFAFLLGFSLAGLRSTAGFGQTSTGPLLKLPNYGAFFDREAGKGDDSSNLLTNPDFEKGMQAWSFQAWAKKGHASVDREERHDDKPSLRLHNPAADNTFVSQKLSVKPGTHYRLSGWIKTKNIVVKQGRGDAGASLWIAGSWEATKDVKDAAEWAYVSLDFDSGTRTEIQVGPRLGQWGGILTGTAWFSQVSVVELEGTGN